MPRLRTIVWEATKIFAALVCVALPIALYEPPPRVVLPTNEHEKVLWLSPDGGELLTAHDGFDDWTFHTWDTRTGALRSSYATELSWVRLRSFAVSSDGSLVVTVRDKTVDGHLLRKKRSWSIPNTANRYPANVS